MFWFFLLESKSEEEKISLLELFEVLNAILEIGPWLLWCFYLFHLSGRQNQLWKVTLSISIAHNLCAWNGNKSTNEDNVRVGNEYWWKNFKKKKSLPIGNLSNQLKTDMWKYNLFKDGSAWCTYNVLWR
jgi:hypothetical protein